MEGFYFLSLSKISFDLTSLINVFIIEWWTKKERFRSKAASHGRPEYSTRTGWQ